MTDFIEGISRKLKDSELARTVRLITCSVSFDFDLLRLETMFPYNIIHGLIRNNQNCEKSDEGVKILRINTDVQSMRIIYTYYNTMNLIIPQSQIERELLYVTCDYFGFIELSNLIEATLFKEENKFNLMVDNQNDVLANTSCHNNEVSNDTSNDISNNGLSDGNIEESDMYITISKQEEQSSEINIPLQKTLSYTINEKCSLSTLDKNILLDETHLRKEYALGNRPTIPRVKFIEVDKTKSKLDHPYTLINSSYRLNNKWITSTDEFLENLKLLSFDILNESMPSNLVVAGGAALKCATKLNINDVPIQIVKELLMYMRIEDDAYLIMDTIQQECNPLIEITDEKIMLITKLISLHSLTLYVKLISTFSRYHRNVGPVRVINFMKDFVKNKKIINSDIDLFLTTEDPDVIFKSIKYIHDRMSSKFGKLHILRTEHAISFYAMNVLVPPIQIVLRAYDSLQHVLLGFDIDSCCIGYDGEVICSQRFLRSIKYGYNLIDLTRLSTTYEIRLMKYFKRGFDIAMTDSSIEKQTNKILELLTKYNTLPYSIFCGIYKLSYLLISYYKLLRIKKVYMSSDYAYKNIATAINMLCSGIDKVDFIYGTELNKVLFDNVSEIQNIDGLPWRQRRNLRAIHRKIDKETILPPLRVMRRNVTKQTDADELFTGSFNPIQIAWYEGSILL